MTVEVTIHPDVLDWALQRSGLTAAEIEKRFPRIDQWREGTKKPTLAQAKKLADSTRLPLGRLLLPVPTIEQSSLPDFRTVHNAKVGQVSANLQEVIDGAEQRLGWYSEYASDEGIGGPDLLGIAAPEEAPESVAVRVRKMFGWKPDRGPQGPDRVATLAALMEDHGLIVMRNSVVGNATRRRLDVHEFRGFTLREGHYALVFINTADSKTAQLFSLAHELGHVLISQPGLSGDEGKNNAIEQWCNRFAAALLMPKARLKGAQFAEATLVEHINRLAPQFGVSREALLWRLVGLGLVEKREANKVVGELRSRNAADDSGRSGSPPFDVLVRSRLGRRFVSTVAEAAGSGNLSETSAAQILGVRKADTFRTVIAGVEGAV